MQTPKLRIFAPQMPPPAKYTRGGRPPRPPLPAATAAHTQINKPKKRDRPLPSVVGENKRHGSHISTSQYSILFLAQRINRHEVWLRRRALMHLYGSL